MADQLSPRPIREWWGSLIDETAKAHGLDPALVEAIVFVESSGRPSAYRYEPDFYKRYLVTDPRHRGENPERISASYGLMQVMFTTAVEHGFQQADPEMLFVPRIGVEYGCRHLAWLLKWAGGDVRKAAAAYNGGTGNYSAVQPQIYADKVMARLAIAQARQA